MGQEHAQRVRISHADRESAVHALAERQAGDVTRQQLLALGFSRTGIDRRLSSGRLLGRYPGVFSLPPARIDPQARIVAAVLAGGPHARASHSSAAYLWGFITHWTPPPEITLTHGDRRPRHILTHRCPSLNRSDNSLQLGVKATSRARTVLDIAPTLPAKQLRGIVNNARHDNVLTLHATKTSSPATPPPRHHAPAPVPRRPLTPHRLRLRGRVPRLHQEIRPPHTADQHRPRRRKSRRLFPRSRADRELDGWEFHKDRHAFEADRERDAENLRHGVVTLRITRERFRADPDREAQRIKDILAWLETRRA